MNLFFFRRPKPLIPTDETLTDLALRAAGHGLWIWHPSTDQLQVSPRIETALGHAKNTLRGRRSLWKKYLHPDDQNPLFAALNTQDPAPFHLQIRLRNAKGKWRWFEINAAPVPFKNYVAGLIQDVTERKTQENKLLHSTIHDPLTNLPTRSLLIKRINALLKTNIEAKRPPALVLLNLNRFRTVNETLGQQAGDALIALLARRLLPLLPQSVSIARTGADEFAALIPPAEPNAASDLTQKLLNALQSPATIQQQELFPSAAAGIVFLNKAHATGEHVLQDAQNALRNARRADTPIAVFSRDHQQSDLALKLENELRRAVKTNEIKPFFQPILRLADNTVAGFEALLRWQHPQRGNIPPSTFIPLAENAGLTAELTRLALLSAARELAEWQRIYKHSTPLFVSVNLSPRELLHDGVVQDVKRAIALSGVAPHTLKLELTESLLMRHPERAAKILAELKDAGAGLSIDDFGSGYASFAYLIQLPCDLIKIDKTLIADPHNSDQSRAIVRAIVGMAHELSMQVVAEGIDTAAKADALRTTGCDFAQGFYFAKPMDAKNVRNFLPRHRHSKAFTPDPSVKTKTPRQSLSSP